MGRMAELDMQMREAGYPHEPGYREPTTSRLAAKATRGRSRGLQRAIQILLHDVGPMTPDEAAARLGESILGIRPRFSEMLALKLIEPTGSRRTNSSGLMAKEYRIV